MVIVSNMDNCPKIIPPIPSYLHCFSVLLIQNFPKDRLVQSRIHWRNAWIFCPYIYGYYGTTDYDTRKGQGHYINKSKAVLQIRRVFENNFELTFPVFQQKHMMCPLVTTISLGWFYWGFQPYDFMGKYGNLSLNYPCYSFLEYWSSGCTSILLTEKYLCKFYFCETSKLLSFMTHASNAKFWESLGKTSKSWRFRRILSNVKLKCIWSLSIPRTMTVSWTQIPPCFSAIFTKGNIYQDLLLASLEDESFLQCNLKAKNFLLKESILSYKVDHH